MPENALLFKESEQRVEHDAAQFQEMQLHSHVLCTKYHICTTMAYGYVLHVSKTHLLHLTETCSKTPPNARPVRQLVSASPATALRLQAFRP